MGQCDDLGARGGAKSLATTSAWSLCDYRTNGSSPTQYEVQLNSRGSCRWIESGLQNSMGKEYLMEITEGAEIACRLVDN